MTKRHLRLQDAIFYLKINPSKSYLLRFDHVSSFDVMDKNTFVNIRWKLFLALITLDCPSCRLPESRFNCVWLWFIGHSPVDLGPSCSPPSCTSSWPPPSSTWSSSNTYWARTHIDCHRIKALILFQLCFRFFSNLCHECQSQFFFLVLSKINPPTKIFHLERTKRKLLKKKRSRVLSWIKRVGMLKEEYLPNLTDNSFESDDSENENDSRGPG